MDDQLRVVGKNHHNLQQSHARVDTDDQQTTLAITFLLDEPEGVADDMQGVRIGDPMFRLVLVGRLGELHRVNTTLTTIERSKDA